MENSFAKKLIITLCTALVCVGIFMSPMPATYANSYDFSRAGDHEYRTVTAAQLLDDVYGDLSEFEKRYFSENESFAVKYSDSVQTSYVRANLTSDEELRVEAFPYKYAGANGQMLIWQPQNAYISGRAMDKEGDGWTTRVLPDDGDIAEIEYATKINVSASDINAFSQSAYNAAKAAADSINEANAEYQRQCEIYQENLAKFEQYKADMEKYERDTELYGKYVSERRIWEQKNKAYADYLQEYDKYLAEVKAYEDYQTEKSKYLEELGNYNRYVGEYETYLEKKQHYDETISSPIYQKALYHLKVLDYITKPVTELDRVLSDAILSDSVTKVLEKKDELVEANVVKYKKVFDVAEKATYELRSLINQLLLQKTDKDKYAYYIMNYEKLDENFCDLLRALAYLYDNETISRLINTKFNRTRQYEILLAQLYYISHALHNGKISNYQKAHEMMAPSSERGNIDDSYRIGAYNAPKLTPAQILGEEGILDDKEDATPLAGGYPDLPEKPTEPTEVKMPEPLPKEPLVPVAPDEVPEPGEPPVEPSEPVRPDEVDEPVEPSEPVHSQKEIEYKKAFESGAVKYREPVKSDYELELKTTVKKYFRNVQFINVRFYESKEARDRGDEPLYQINDAELLSDIQYEGELPQTKKLGYDSAFEYWEDEDGVRISLSQLQTDKFDLDLFPHYKFTPQKCKIVWEINGNEISDVCDYDSAPYYDDNISPPDRTDGRLSRFTGWELGGVIYGQGTLPTLTGSEVLERETRIVAVFENGLIVEWLNENGELIERTSIWSGETPTPPTAPTKPDDEARRYYFAGWGRKIEPIYEDITYRAQFIDRFIIGDGENGQGGRVSYGDDEIIAQCQTELSDISILLDIANEKNLPVKLVKDNFTLWLSMTAVSELNEFNVASFSLSQECIDTSKNSEKENSEDIYKTYTYLLCFVDADGKEVDAKSAIQFTIVNSFDAYDAGNSRLTYTNANGEFTDVRYSNLTSNELSFSMIAGIVYRIRPYHYFSITISNSELTVSIGNNKREAYETVFAEFSDIPKGKFVKSIYVVDASGENVPYEQTENGIVFIMPSSDVVVGITCQYYKYNVVFKVDGKVIWEKEMEYGSIIDPPFASKPTDGEFEYTFVGWDKDVTLPVEGDIEFNAIFDKTPFIIPSPSSPSALLILIRVGKIAIPVLVVLIAALVVTLIVVKKRKKAVAGVGTEVEDTNERQKSFGGRGWINSGWIKIKAFFVLVGKKIAWLAKYVWAAIVFAARFVYSKFAAILKSGKNSEKEKEELGSEISEAASNDTSVEEKSQNTPIEARDGSESEVVATAEHNEEVVATVERDNGKVEQENGGKGVDKKTFTLYIKESFIKVKNFIVAKAKKFKESVHNLIVAMSDDDISYSDDMKKVESMRQTQKSKQTRPNTTRKGNESNAKNVGKKNIIIVRKNFPPTDGKNHSNTEEK